MLHFLCSIIVFLLNFLGNLWFGVLHFLFRVMVCCVMFSMLNHGLLCHIFIPNHGLLCHIFSTEPWFVVSHFYAKPLFVLSHFNCL